MPEEAKEEKSKFAGYAGEIVEILPQRTGMFGSVIQAMVKILEGHDKGRVIRRNFVGFIKKGDIVRLPDTTREDKPIVVK
ncbi:MAG: 30S ribosomal protein S28e [Candidatus Micrarchaeia archaeon]|jgi:small subunit ribosomal protein S28e